MILKYKSSYYQFYQLKLSCRKQITTYFKHKHIKYGELGAYRIVGEAYRSGINWVLSDDLQNITTDLSCQRRAIVRKVGDQDPALEVWSSRTHH